MYSATSCTDHVVAEIRETSTLRLAADVRDGTARDLAVALGNDGLAMVRCVCRQSQRDHTALATMVAAGDFVWAGLVFSEYQQGDHPFPVEAFHVSELPRLIERLRSLQRAEAS